MIRVKILKTGRIISVTNNEAHGLIERGLAKKVMHDYEKKPMMPSSDIKRRGKYIIK